MLMPRPDPLPLDPLFLVLLKIVVMLIRALAALVAGHLIWRLILDEVRYHWILCRCWWLRHKARALFALVAFLDKHWRA